MEKGVVIKPEKKTVTIEDAFKIVVNLMKQEKQRREDAEKAMKKELNNTCLARPDIKAHFEKYKQ